MAWTWRWRAVVFGIGSGLVVGTLIGNGYGWLGGLAWGCGAGIVVWSLSGWGVVPADLSAAVHATALLERERQVFWRFVQVGTAAGVTLGALMGLMLPLLRVLTYPSSDDRLDLMPVGIGLGLAVLFAPALALIVALSRTAWGETVLTRHYLARRRNVRRLPAT
ncbi:hypothetical protein LVX13_01620 [Streptomyces albulus]|uniref:hypothetical protein n=1 Tax=Streptomyces noursei TaxID=1971 RepID=UPI001F3F9481|nr:hypothetical protein [Streptomyces noursei]MCE4941837.1 hypothetical protein [Streptomyces noursei]